MLERLRSRFTRRSPRPADQEPSSAAPDDAPLTAAREAVTTARDAAWQGVGTADTDVLDPLAPLANPAFTGGPRWPGFRQAFQRVGLADDVGLVASDELATVVQGGGGARQQIAQGPRRLSAAELASPDRPSVLPLP